MDHSKDYATVLSESHKTSKTQQKKQKVNVVFNYSNQELNSDMLKVLNKGLNYSILPHKIDNTLVLTEFRRFERTILWNEFWKEKGNNEENKKTNSIFKILKNNFPNYKSSESLKAFLNSIKSDLMDPLNRKKVAPNLNGDEYKALLELSKLQKERKIVIKQCDKGAGIIILNYDDYIKSCNEHLEMTKNVGDQVVNYYQRVEESEFIRSKERIKEVLEEARDNDIIDKDEFEALNPRDKLPSKFYSTYKVHKKHDPGETPPVRPIISASGSSMENIGKYVQHHINEFGSVHSTYLKDTPDFLRTINEVNEKEELENDTILVTMDVAALFTNIPNEEGMEAVREVFEEKQETKFHKEFVLRLLEILLHNNYFEFNGEMFKQIIGAAMGSQPIPNYANIFMAKKIDRKIISIFEKYATEEHISLKLFKRFLDDLFFIFKGSSKALHKILDEINEIHPNIKLTMNHTSIDEDESCDCPIKETIPFLDVSMSIKNGKIETDLYRKPTDRNQYLLPSSCHPNDCIRNIPFSLALRIVKICSNVENRNKRCEELKQMLMEREYDEAVVDSAINRAKKISREKALEPKIQKSESEKRPVYVSTYDPRLPNISNIINKHWRAQSFVDNNFKKNFPKPPMVAFKRQKNIRSFLIRAKVSPLQNRIQRFVKGMFPCMKQCINCPFINSEKKIKGPNFTWNINGHFTCETNNIIYMIECKKDHCKSKYIGQSGKKCAQRMSQHRGYVNNRNLNQPTGYHFNQPGHSVSDMRITVLEKVKHKDELYRREREKYFINKFDTFKNGMNKQP